MKNFISIKTVVMVAFIFFCARAYSSTGKCTNEMGSTPVAPCLLASYGFITSCQRASRLVSGAKDLDRHDSFFTVIEALLTLVGEMQCKCFCSDDQPQIEEFVNRLAMAMATLQTVDTDGLFAQTAKLTKNSLDDRQQEIIALLKTDQGLSYIQAFFQNLQLYTQQEMPGMITSFDKVLSPVPLNTKAFFGLFTVPELPNVDDMSEHHATLLSVVVEAWNFFSIFMNTESKQEYFTEQIVILIDYLKERIVEVVQQSFDKQNSTQATGGFQLVININL